MKVVLEGLTGTGKTRTLAALRRADLLPEVVIPEEATFGDAMLETAEPADAAHVLRRLAAVLDGLEGEPTGSFLLERAHPSYFAIGVPWDACRPYDERLLALGACVVLLTVPPPSLAVRSLLRREYGGTDWQRLASHFGSEAAALDALRSSQERRLEARALSRLPHLVIDTRDEDWDAVARSVAAFARGVVAKGA